MKTFYLVVIAILFFEITNAQVGIGNINPKAILDIKASNVATPANTDGILIPRINAFPTTSPGADQNGMLVFLTTTNSFYYWDNATTSWLPFSGAKKINDLSDGKSDNDGTNNGSSIFFGINAGANDDASDNGNVGVGFEALKTNTTGNYNVAYGSWSLSYNGTGSYNTANGTASLYFCTTGSSNTAIGHESLMLNRAGNNATAIGTRAMYYTNDDITSFTNYNVGVGYEALMGTSSANGSTGNNNTALGYQTLRDYTTGDYNTANGVQSLYSTTTGDWNTANGYHSLYSNVGGGKNTAYGANSGFKSLGNGNVFLGYTAGYNEIDSNKLYIENSNADANNALIYGEFGSDSTAVGNILRINGQLQIGTSLANRYALPTADGTANQILQTNGNGTISWGDNSSLGLKINDLTDGKSDNDGTQDGSSIFLGINAGAADDSSDNYNVGIGFEALKSTTSGNNNVSLGWNSLKGNVLGISNTAIGSQTLVDNSGTSNGNTAIGFLSMWGNRNGSNNTAIGINCLDSNFDGNENVAFGILALEENNYGDYNTSIGSKSLQLLKNTNADGNIAVGYKAGDNLTSGTNNIIIGTNRDLPNPIGSYQMNIGDIIYGISVNGAAGGGSIGISVTNPSEKFEVNGAIKIGSTTSTTQGVIRYSGTDFEGYSPSGWKSLTSDSNGWKITGNSGTNASSNFLGTTDNINLAFRTNNTERMRLTTAGILKLITISGNAIQVKNDDNFSHSSDNNIDFGDPIDAWMLSSQEGTFETSGIYGDRDFVTVWSPADSNRMIRFLDEDYWSDNDGNPYNNTAELAYVDATGQFIQASDKNRKQNIQKISNSIQKLNQLNGYTYEYKLSTSEKQKGQLPVKTSGVIAQELYEVLPEAVQISKNGEYFVHYAGIIPLLIEALKEQQKEILELKQLEQRILILEKNSN